MSGPRPSWRSPLLAAAVLALLAFLVLASCAPGVNSQIHTVSAEGIVAGFWRGLWHGLIAPITFLISLFSRTVSVYEVHNNGGWYDFGFLLGLCTSLGGCWRGGRWRGRGRR